MAPRPSRWTLVAGLIVLLSAFPRIECNPSFGEFDADGTVEEEDEAVLHFSNPPTTRPFACDPPASLGQRERHSVMVSTLDGRVWCLDASTGSPLWSMETDSQPLLDSSLGDMEFFAGEDTFRLIPSLDGNLYMFGASYLRAIPVSAEALLASSLRLGTDAVAGGRRVSTYGVQLQSGALVYACSIEGCETYSSGAAELVIRRTTQTVRSVDASTGVQRWNVTVGEHELQLSEAAARAAAECTNAGGGGASSEVDVQVNPAQGTLTGIHRHTGRPLWQQQMESPVAQAWQLRGWRLSELSLFDGRVVPRLDWQEKEAALPSHAVTVKDSLDSLIYFGLYDDEAYIIPSAEQRLTLRRLAQSGGASEFFGDKPTTTALVPTDHGRMYIAPDSDIGRYFALKSGDANNYGDAVESSSSACFGNCPTCSTDEANALALRQNQHYPTGFRFFL